MAEPVLRFDSQFHRCIDATVWLYGTKGRPVAVQEVECYRRLDAPEYFYCLVSLCDGLIEARWPGEREWSSTKPGVEMRELPKGPKPASTEAARMRQMKGIVRRFTATRIDVGNIREENRVLAQQLHRYRDPHSGLQDGAIFVFVANGTAPDLLLTPRVVRSGPGPRDLELRRAPDDHGRTPSAPGRQGGVVGSPTVQSGPGRVRYLAFLLRSTARTWTMTGMRCCRCSKRG